MKAVEEGSESLREASGAPRLLMAGTSYKTSDLGVREALVKTIGAEGIADPLPGAQESVVLSTCNRFEVYFATTSPEETYSRFLRMVKDRAGIQHPERSISQLVGVEAVAHLFRVAAGIESVVVGEPQILAQVRAAGIRARKQGDAKRILSPLFDRATRVGSKVRSTSGLGSGEASLSDLAVEAAEGLMPGSRDILLIGSGKMVQLAARRLVRGSRRLYVASRRRPQAGLQGSIPVGYADIRKTARMCDVIICATVAGRPVVTRADLRGRRRKVVIDLGMPRNVSPLVRALPNVRLVDLDDLAKMAQARDRALAVDGAERAIAREAAEFYGWLVQTRLSSTLADIYSWADGVRVEELNRALGKLQTKDPREARILDAMVRRLVSKLMARPSRFARSRRGALTEEEKLDLLGAVFGLGADREG